MTVGSYEKLEHLKRALKTRTRIVNLILILLNQLNFNFFFGRNEFFSDKKINCILEFKGTGTRGAVFLSNLK